MAEGLDVLHESLWRPLKSWGFEHPFFSINATTIMHTWIALVLLLILIIMIRLLMNRTSNVLVFLATSFVDYFMKLIEQSLGRFYFNHFSFITSLFVFIFFCSALSIMPWLEEPTQDLNTTLALGILSFSYNQIYAIYLHGFIAYIKDYFSPFFIMFPLNVVGKLATVVSISFRLFGNISGGAIISKIYFTSLQGSIIFQLLGIVSGLNLLIVFFFGLFEGFLQAFVFAMLSLTYLSIAIFGESGEHEQGHA